MKKLIKRFNLSDRRLDVGVILLYLLFSLALFYPLLQGKQLFQSDSVQYSGMARQLNENRLEKGEELYWIDNAFGGMPTYQLGAKYPYDILTPIHKIFVFCRIPLICFFFTFWVLLCFSAAFA